MKKMFLGCTVGLQIVLLLFIASTSGEENASNGFPPGEGRNLVAEICTVCHSSSIILQNRMTRQRWDETITWMQEKQGLTELPQVTRNKILDYLSNVQGVVDASRSGKKMYEYNYPPNPL